MKGTLLLAVDHGGPAEKTSAIIRDLATAGGNQVVVLHVHQVAVGRWGRLVVETEPGEDCVAEVVAKDLQNAGINATYETIETAMGRVGAAISTAADRVDASLIVMGTHSESDVASLTLGSASHRVLHRAHRPVLLVPSD
ncbi:hypothetical protein acdb102_24080 [Acidothermaceae bacterium B102]|nr:hypothetical protein acdb102_24080 [Acidothermaceae bacterium B102]